MNMKNLTRTICLTLVILLGSLMTGCGADFNKGTRAMDSGDFKTALRHLKPLARQGHFKAQNNLGLMYKKGLGVPQDYKTAVKWYTLAAEQGHANAQYNLGNMYHNGRGVPQNYVYAYMWGDIANVNENQNGTELRNIAAKKMTAAQIAKAQELASECVRKKYKGC
jgi:uncharacterized protein